MSTFIQITEVGPRDGFQNIKAFIPTDLKIKIIDRLVESGRDGNHLDGQSESDPANA